jgi:uncharacterized membrane protein YraQ (UPF0718 family)
VSDTSAHIALSTEETLPTKTDHFLDKLSLSIDQKWPLVLLGFLILATFEVFVLYYFIG